MKEMDRNPQKVKINPTYQFVLCLLSLDGPCESARDLVVCCMSHLTVPSWLGQRIFFVKKNNTRKGLGFTWKISSHNASKFPVKPGGKAVCRGVGLWNYLFCPPCCLNIMKIDHAKMMMMRMMMKSIVFKFYRRFDDAHAKELSILTPSGRCSTEALSGCGTCQEYRCDTITTNIIIQVQLT